MRTRPALPYSKSLLAAAVIIASGCATTAPGSPDSPADTGFSGPLVDAGRATANVTSRALDRAGYLLGLHDDGGQDGELDEVDLALLEEDAPLPTQAVTTTGVNDDGLAVARFVGSDAGEDVDVTALPETPSGTPAARLVALNDHTVTVGPDDTLWTIAKRTTGDATNWHALADVNDLGQNAAVYPGQTLTIPADMLRPELAGAQTVQTAAQPAAQTAVQTTVQTASEPAAPEVEISAAAPAPVPVPADEAPVALAAASPVAPVTDSPADGARGFDVQSGESLWEFARRTTGDATEWQVIAAHNGFDEQRARNIRAGERIFVPQALVRVELGGTDAPKPEQGALQVDRAPSVTGAPGVSPRLVPIAAASEALPADPALPAAADVTPIAAPDEGAAVVEDVLATAPDAGLDETRDMTIVEASFNKPGAEEYTPDTVTAIAQELPASAPEEVTISGTYYPKAVYNDADFSSSLLMRVSPGTRLRVAGVQGDWYAVETEVGTGYVHDRDLQ